MPADAKPSPFALNCSSFTRNVSISTRFNLQIMPLVGVPSFIEFSEKRDLTYFFVLVRRPVGPSTNSSTGSDNSERQKRRRTLPPRRSSPTEAFVAASTDEPWGSREVASSQESAEAKQAAQEQAAKVAKQAAEEKPRVVLPFNLEV